MIGRFACHWGLGLRSTCLIGPLAVLGRGINNNGVLLGQRITHKLIKGGALVTSHVLGQLGSQSPLETSKLLDLSINKLRSIARQVIKSMKILSQTLSALSQVHELGVLESLSPVEYKCS